MLKSAHDSWKDNNDELTYKEVLVTKDDQTKKYKNVRSVQKNSHILNNNIDYEITLESGKKITVGNPQTVETTPEGRKQE
ncbi:hypothetical protein LMB49_10680 [Limosilactobacillus reuteri]|nr:hypothetical protein [Limosilactobacillus reuteri]MCC4370574.1 hypothetical protein [Limosilactobacillus reuteri]MCC4371857.1 hypothetical protein [Limosilactobacillus reuteri]